jgi:uncharacterized OB-fold protein
VAELPIQDGVYTLTDDGPRLLASRCADCSELTFPKQKSCPACTGRESEEVQLSPRGTLWTWTVQNFPPPPPYTGPQDREVFVPYGVGYVELPEGIRVEGRLTENDPSRLEIGMDMEIVLEKFIQNEDGDDLMTFAFRPAAG